MERQVVNPWRWQDAFGFVQGNKIGRADRFLFCAGQTSVDSEGRPVHSGDMKAQIVQALDNLETVLRDAGMSLSDVVRLNYYTTDVDGFMPRARHSADALRKRSAGRRRLSSGSAAWHFPR